MSEKYFDHPYLSEDAANWLIESQASLVGFDVMTPDMPIRSRHSGFDYPIHHMLMANDVLIVENLADMALFEGRYVELLVAPVRVKGADGCPVVVLARSYRSETEKPTLDLGEA